MGDVGRWAALAAGFPDSVAGATINRFCGSSLSATINIGHAIKAGDLGVGHRLRRRVDVAVGLGADEGRRAVQPAGPGVHARHHVGGRRRPTEPEVVGAQRLHRDDRDRAERRRPVRADPRRDRRVRAAVAAARQGGARLRPAGQGDHARDDSRRPRRRPSAASSTTSSSATTPPPSRWPSCPPNPAPPR